MTHRIDFVPATRRDIEAFYGPEFRWTFRAWAAKLGDETLGVGGLYYTPEHVIAFSSFTPKMKEFPLAMARGVKKIMAIVGNRPCYAIADENIPDAPKLLERIGFEHLEGRIYRWPVQKT